MTVRLDEGGFAITDSAIVTNAANMEVSLGSSSNSNSGTQIVSGSFLPASTNALVYMAIRGFSNGTTATDQPHNFAMDPTGSTGYFTGTASYGSRMNYWYTHNTVKYNTTFIIFITSKHGDYGRWWGHCRTRGTNGFEYGAQLSGRTTSTQQYGLASFKVYVSGINITGRMYVTPFLDNMGT